MAVDWGMLQQAQWLCRPMEIPPLVQNPHGYRFSVDTVLLAQMVRLPPDCTVVDLGTGCGVLLITLALQNLSLRRAIGVEIQASLLRLAKRNAHQWRLKETLQWIHGDVRRIRRYLPASVADVVVTNPPYRPATRGQLSPTTERAIARHEISGRLLDFLKAARYVVKPSGTLFMAYSYWRRYYLATQILAARWVWRWIDFCQMPHKGQPQFIRMELIPQSSELVPWLGISRTWFSSQRGGFQTEIFDDVEVLKRYWPEAYAALPQVFPMGTDLWPVAPTPPELSGEAERVE